MYKFIHSKKQKLLFLGRLDYTPRSEFIKLNILSNISDAKTTNLNVESKRSILFYHFYLKLYFLLIFYTHKVIILPGRTPNLLFNTLSILLRKDILFDYHGSTYQSSVHIRKTKSFLSIFAIKIFLSEWLLVRYSSRVAWMSKDDCKYHLKFYKINYNKNRDKIFCLPQNTQQSIKPLYKFSKGITDRPTFAWWGLESPSHGLDTILNALINLSHDGYNFNFLILPGSLGLSNANLKLIDKIAKNSNVNILNDNFSDISTRKMLSNNVDLSFGMMANTVRSGFLASNKTIESLSIGIPLLTMDNKMLKNTLGVGYERFFCEPTVSSIYDAISYIYRNPCYLEKLGKGAQKIIMRRCNPESYLDFYKDFL